MSFTDAVRSALTQYVGFSGRARRSEYWWFTAFNVLVAIVAGVLDAIAGTNLIGWIAIAVLLLPGIAVSVRRLHDIGRTGWWLLIILVPLVGFIVLIVFAVTDGQPTPNEHGPSPKAVPAVA